MTKPSDRRQKRETRLRNELWPDLIENDLWNRGRCKGFTTIPRTLPLLMSIMDDMAGKGKPVSRTYLTLWGRVHDEAVLKIRDESTAAMESGFSGGRRTTAWRSRMRILRDLGFILAEEAGSGEFSTVLLLNPHKVVKSHWARRTKKGAHRIPEEKYRALMDRADEVGANDFLDEDVNPEI